MPLAVTLNVIFALGTAIVGFILLCVVMKIDSLFNN